MFFNLDQQVQSNNPVSQQRNAGEYGRDAMFDTGENQAETEQEKSKTRNLLIAGGAILGAGAIVTAIILLHRHKHDKWPTPPTPSDVTISIDPRSQHLSYRAFDIVNNSIQAYQITNLSLASIAAGATGYNELKLCGIDDGANCSADFVSTCTPNGVLEPGKSCKL